MKKILSVMILACTGLFRPVAAQDFWDGTSDTSWPGEGTEASPYIISTPAQLAGLAARTNAKETFEGVCFRLDADLYMSDPLMPAADRPLWVPIGDKSLANVDDPEDDPAENPGDFYADYKWFKGCFDGAGHTIYNLWYSGTTDYDDWNDPFGSGKLDFTAWNKALFGLLDGAVIRNLRLENVSITGSALIGGLAVEAHNSTFSGVSVSGDISSPDFDAGGSAAGLVAEAYACRFSDCSADVRVKGKSGSGALVGRLYGASLIENCTVAGEVYGSNNIGGMVGVAARDENSSSDETPLITGSLSSATVTVLSGRNQGNSGAGFIGLNYGTVIRCGASGNVKVTSDAGAGFCYDNFGTIETCYALGNVYNDEYGVLLSAFVVNNGYDAGYGEHYPGRLLNCYGAGRLYAPEAPSDMVAQPTRYTGFAWANFMEAGSVMANCYYDSTLNPVLFTDPECGSYGVATEYMKSQAFVEQLNYMAAIMGTSLWQYVEGSYPLPADTDASPADIIPFFAGGEGTESSPWLISTREQLRNLAFAANRNWNFIGQHFLQTADIALNEPIENWGDVMPEIWTPIAEYTKTTAGQTRTYRFCGVYDGGYHTVANMYIDEPAYNYQGLFGLLGKEAVIRNLGVTDAWISAKNCSVGLIAGAARLHNELSQFQGNVTIANCWSTGQVLEGVSGGILGESNYGGLTSLDACWSTYEGYRPLVGTSSLGTTEENGCWFAGTMSNGFTAYETLFRTYIDEKCLSYPFNPEPAIAVSTQYMMSKEFVNDLNYAAAGKGFEGNWGWNEGAYPSFSGSKPALTVTLSDGEGPDISFKAFAGSTISMPSAPEREGYTLVGWYTDPSFTQPFDFASTLLSSDITLYGRWAIGLVPDYSIFGNKFAKTFTITSAEQLLGLANIVNGTAEGIDRSDFEGKTVKLGNDIELNDVADFAYWGSGVTPMEFTSIGNQNYAYAFNGTFDGQGHAIIGMYMQKTEDNGVRGSLFDLVGPSGKITDLVLRDAFIDCRASGAAALLVNSLSGSLVRCGAEGRIVNSRPDDASSLAGLVVTVESTGSLSECYADVRLSGSRNNTAGLAIVSRGSIENCYAIGSATLSRYGAFGGLVSSVYNSATISKSYSAMALEFGEAPSSVYCGGAYGYADSSASVDAYYDVDLVETAFSMLPVDWSSNGPAVAMAKGNPLSTADMKKMASFPEFDFATVWGRRNDQNSGYPYLRWTAPGLENETDNTGVEDVLAPEAAAPEFYNIHGLRVSDSDLAPGVYIKRRGKTASKVYIR